MKTDKISLIAIKGKRADGVPVGYLVPRLIQLTWFYGLKEFGLQYLWDRLCGWTVWFTVNQEDYDVAFAKLRELQKAHKFMFKTCELEW